MNTDIASQDFQPSAEIWEDIFKNNEWGKYPMIDLVRFTARNFYKADDRRAVKLLEIGSGPGANLWYLAREGFTVYGIDFSKTACERTRKRLKEDGLDDQIGELKVGDFYEKLDEFEDGFFDAIIDMEALYCNSFNRSRAILEKAVSKLKCGGKLLSVTFADQTTGLVGEEVDYHALLPSSGPCANKGFSRYTTYDDIEKLYGFSDTQIENIELLERHLNSRERIREYVIQLRKK